MALSFFITAAIIGLLPAFIARRKGHSFGKWWFVGSALFIVALPCSLFLENKNKKKCPACRESIDTTATICRFCQTAV